MTTIGESKAIELEVHVKARPETVFQLLTDPSKHPLWMAGKATLEPRPGGVYRLVFNEREAASGQYVEVIPNRRVVFTWGWEQPGSPVPPGSSTVEIDLVPTGDETIVKLRHTGLPEPATDMHRDGWVLYMDRLAVAGSGGNPGADPNAQPHQM